MRTTAVQDGDEWVLNGTKNWITNAGIADFYVVFAVTDREARRITAFVVEADRPGFSIGKLEHKMGIKGSPTGSPVLEDVRVPAGQRHRRGGQGPLRRAGDARAHAPGRRGAGGRHRPGRDRLRQRSTRRSASPSARRSTSTRRSSSSSPTWRPRTAAARELLYKACALADRGDPRPGKYSSMAKLFASDAAMAVTVEAVQVLGGYGYVTEYPVERMMRDAKITQIYEGTNEIQRLVIARAMRTEAAPWPRPAASSSPPSSRSAPG